MLYEDNFSKTKRQVNHRVPQNQFFLLLNYLLYENYIWFYLPEVIIYDLYERDKVISYIKFKKTFL